MDGDSRKPWTVCLHSTRVMRWWLTSSDCSVLNWCNTILVLNSHNKKKKQEGNVLMARIFRLMAAILDDSCWWKGMNELCVVLFKFFTVFSWDWIHLQEWVRRNWTDMDGRRESEKNKTNGNSGFWEHWCLSRSWKILLSTDDFDERREQNKNIVV